jgi:hypothetical protein
MPNVSGHVKELRLSASGDKFEIDQCHTHSPSPLPGEPDLRNLVPETVKFPGCETEVNDDELPRKNAAECPLDQ